MRRTFQKSFCIMFWLFASNITILLLFYQRRRYFSLKLCMKKLRNFNKKDFEVETLKLERKVERTWYFLLFVDMCFLLVSFVYILERVIHNYIFINYISLIKILIHGSTCSNFFNLLIFLVKKNVEKKGFAI